MDYMNFKAHEDMNTVLTLLLVVVAILQIILFCKVWGMTNDVDKICKKMLHRNSLPDLIKEAVKGHPDIKFLLYDAIFYEMEQIVLYTDDEHVPARLEDLRTKYKLLYKKAGVQFPEEFKTIKSYQDFKHIFRMLK